MNAQMIEAYWAATKDQPDDLDVIEPIATAIAHSVHEVFGCDMTIAECRQAARLVLTGRKRMKNRK